MLDMIFSWNTVWYLMLFLYIPSCLGLVIIVLLQKGKGVGFAGAFGAGPGGEAVFGPRSSKSLPQKITYTMAGIYMLLALCMSMLSGNLGSAFTPSLVEDTGVTPVVTGEAGSMDALFGDQPVSAPEAPAAEITTETPAETTPVNEITVETPAAEAPATEAPAEEAAPALETPAETPAAVEAPAEQPAEAPAEDAAPEAPAAQ